MKDRNIIFQLLIDKVKLVKEIVLKGLKKIVDKENENTYKFYPLTANSTIKLSDDYRKCHWSTLLIETQK